MDLKTDIDKMKGFAERGTDLFENMLWAFKDAELEDDVVEYLKIAIMAVAFDVYNQGYSEGNQAGFEEHEKLKEVGLI